MMPFSPFRLRRFAAVLTLPLGFFAAAAFGAEPLWRSVSESLVASAGQRDIVPERYRLMELDLDGLEPLLADAESLPGGLDAWQEEAPTLTVPLADGGSMTFRFREAEVMAPELAARHPGIRSFAGQGVEDPTATIRFGVTRRGFYATIYSRSGSVWIDPYQRGDTEHYVVYKKADYQRATGFSCGVEGRPEVTPDALSGSLPSNGGTLRTYRLAVAATGEYTTFHSSPDPANVVDGLAAIVTAMNRVNGIYDRELSLTMQLVANNDQIVYTDGATDPYTNNSGGTMLGQNQSNLDSVIGSANYDIGHVFSTGGGGIASLGVPCTGGKARGVTGLSSPIGDIFWVDYVAHEMGHQWGGNHTFNGSSGNCVGGRNGSTAYEPGSGSTIQAYAGICSPQNLQNTSDDYFHTISLQEMVAYSTAGSGNACDVEVANGNDVPVVDAGPGHAIPTDTPFELCGSATDSHALTYNWEQFNLGPTGHPDSPSGNAPIFRSWPATTSPCRTFPRLEDLLAGTTVLGELLPTYARDLDFRLTARDNRAGGGAFGTDAVHLDVIDTGSAFEVTSQNVATTWNFMDPETVTWNVAGTDMAPISCAEVDIRLLYNSGSSSVLLAAAEANDGSASVTAPNVNSSSARVRVECSDNVFFDISDLDFEVIGVPDSFSDGFESE